MALWAHTQLVKPKTSAARQIACLSPTPSVSQRILEVARDVEDSSAHIVFVGPTKAGKSTLINAMLGRLAVPSGALPNTLLPVSFYSDGVENRFYAVYLEGEGLDEFLDIELEFRELNSETAFQKVAEINAQARVAMQAVTDFEELLRRFPSLKEWRLEVNVPSAENGSCMPVTLTDCPGGSEGGVVGMAVQAFLAHQVESSALNVLVVRADNITALQTPHRVASFFGGKIASSSESSENRDLRPQTLLVVNGVKDTATRQGIEEMFAGAAMQESLRSLEVVRTFFLNALTLLAHRLCGRILDALQEQRPDPEVTGVSGSPEAPSAPDSIADVLQACGLGSFAERLSEQGVEEIDFLRTLEEEDVVQVARDVGMKPLQIKQFVKRWAALHQQSVVAAVGAAVAPSQELPEFGVPQFKRFEPELNVIFHACCFEADLEDAYEEERKSFPRRLERAVRRGHTDESAFDEFFAHHLDVSWPEMLTKFMLIKSLEIAMPDAERLRLQALAAAMPADEVRLRRQKLEDASLEMGLPDNLEAFRSSIEQELMFLPDMERAIEEMERASRLLGDEAEGGDLTALVVEQATDREFAIAWEANVGEAVLPIYIFQQAMDKTYTHGRRVMPNRENARALVNAYSDWCLRRIDRAVLYGRVATESSGRWLASELPEYAELVGTLPEPNRIAVNVVRPHLPRSKRQMKMQERPVPSQASHADASVSATKERGQLNIAGKTSMNQWDEHDVFIMGSGCSESSFYRKPVVDQEGELQPVRRQGLTHMFNVQLLPFDFWAGLGHYAASQITRQFSELGTRAAQHRLDELVSDGDRRLSGLESDAETAADKSARAAEVVARLHALRQGDATPPA